MKLVVNMDIQKIASIIGKKLKEDINLRRKKNVNFRVTIIKEIINQKIVIEMIIETKIQDRML